MQCVTEVKRYHKQNKINTKRFHIPIQNLLCNTINNDLSTKNRTQNFIQSFSLTLIFGAVFMKGKIVSKRVRFLNILQKVQVVELVFITHLFVSYFLLANQITLKIVFYFKFKKNSLLKQFHILSLLDYYHYTYEKLKDRK